VIITTFNRPAQLACCLEALARSEYDHRAFEVIVIDDGGSEPLDSIIAAFRSKLNLRLAVQPNGGPAKARNTGSDLARNEFLAFTDDDCEPHPRWLCALASRFQHSPECLAGGPTVNGLPFNPWSSASQMIVDLVYAYYNADSENARFFAANNLAVRTDLFRASGKFHEQFRTAEDREFCNRWQSQGRRLVFEPLAVVTHRHPLGFVAYARQHFEYGRGAARFHHLCAARNSGHFRDHFGFYARMPQLWLALWATRREPHYIRMLLLLSLWQVANATGYLRGLFNRSFSI
jgi:glycosyltransferase involved in cell wall biosynthesis